VDLFVALDVSLSMKAEDIKPNRLEKAKFELRNLISRLKGDRIGLVVFAGEAYTQFPLTTDYSAANLFLDAVDVDAVPTPGTSIESAIGRALESFDFEEPSTKVLVIITDGENTEGDAFEAAEEAARKGVLLYAIGMGSPSGTPIPVINAAGQQVDFKRDASGSVVMTKLSPVSGQRKLMSLSDMRISRQAKKSASKNTPSTTNPIPTALARVNFSPRKMTPKMNVMSGYAAGVGEQGTALIGKFIKSLQENNDFYSDMASIDLVSTKSDKVDKQDVMSFRITCIYR
jgi:uncharacterized protein YegL